MIRCFVVKGEKPICHRDTSLESLTITHEPDPTTGLELYGPFVRQ